MAGITIIQSLMAKRKAAATNKPVTPNLPAPINPDGVQSVYCNNMEVSISVFDARMTFNEIIIDHGGTLTVVRRANVVMSTPHFQAMIVAMQKQLEALKKQLEAAKKAQSAIQ
jgi:hypothetical protein